MAGEPILVVCFLRGGVDGLNAVVPVFEDDYHRQRPTLAMERRKPGTTDGGAIPLDDRFALAPGLEALLPHHREGRLAVVHAIGSDNATGSHFESEDQLEHGATMDRPLGSGWAARWLRTLPDASALSALAFGRAVPESLRGAPSVTAVTELEEIRLETRDGDAPAFADALGALYTERPAASGPALRRAGRDALALMRRIEDIRADDGSGSEYPRTDLARSLSQIARVARNDVGLRVAAVNHGGFDTHFGQTLLLESRLRELAEALAAFHTDLGSLAERVTVVCVTEFGRRVYENASLGTDHGRGSIALVLGGGVAGGQVATRWPGLDAETFQGPGGLRVTTDYRDLLWEILARRFGAEDRKAVFPGLEHRPVGVMA